jgi:hypothetical protein
MTCYLLWYLFLCNFKILNPVNEKISLSLSVVYESLEESSVFRRLSVFSLAILLLSYFVLSIQFIFSLKFNFNDLR